MSEEEKKKNETTEVVSQKSNYKGFISQGAAILFFHKTT